LEEKEAARLAKMRYKEDPRDKLKKMKKVSALEI